jgi:hypothetical protein
MFDQRFCEMNEYVKINICINSFYQKITSNDKQYARNKKINKYRRKSNSSWMKNLYVNLHDFLTCWIRNEQDSSNMKNLIEMKIRYKSNWQNKLNH